MKKVLQALFVLCFAFFAVAQAQTQVIMWSTAGNPATQSLVDAFNASHDNIEVQWERLAFGDLTKKIRASRRTGGLPDVILFPAPMVSTYAKLGILTPLTDLVEELGRDTFPQAILGFNTVEGEIYGIPFFILPKLLYYRTDYFEEAGLSGPPTTWEEFRKAARATTTEDHYGFSACINDPQVSHIMHVWMAAGGADTFNDDLEVAIDNPQTIKTLTLLDWLYENGYFYPGVTGAQCGQARINFANGLLAMSHTSTSFLNTLARNDMMDVVGVARVPKDNSNLDYVSFHSLSVTQGADVEAAKTFIDWVFERENYLQYFAETRIGEIPARTNIIEDGSYYSLERVAPYKGAIKAAAETLKHPTLPGLRHGQNPFATLFDAQGIYKNMLLRVLLDEDTPEEAAAWGAEKMKAIVRNVRGQQ